MCVERERGDIKKGGLIHFSTLWNDITVTVFFYYLQQTLAAKLTVSLIALSYTGIHIYCYNSRSIRVMKFNLWSEVGESIWVNLNGRDI